MAARKVEQESFWPGYVDAIINVVLNILFMVAVFTVALSTIDMSEHKASPNKEGAAKQSAAAKADMASQAGPQEVALPAQPYKSPSAELKDTNAQSAANKEPLVKWASRRAEEGAQIVTVDFDERVVDIPPDQAKDLSTALRNAGGENSKGQWLIWVNSDTRQASASRLAYMRVVSVRNALLDSGVSPQAIQTRILDVRESSDAAANRVQLSFHSI